MVADIFFIDNEYIYELQQPSTQIYSIMSCKILIKCGDALS